MNLHSKHALLTAFLLLPLTAVGCDRGGDTTADADMGMNTDEAVASITAEDLRQKVFTLAADSMRGRNTPSPEIEATALYIAGQMEAAGVQPGAADGGWIHRYGNERWDEGVTAPNVVAIIPGSDSILRDEYVVYSAHMDHVGVRQLPEDSESTDSIWNGADDNASGTATLMEVAEAMAELEVKPRRSTMFVWVSGEEKGLLGSAAFANDPSVPVESMVANFNVDMVGRNWTDTIVAIGKEHSELGEIMNRVNDANPAIGMTAIDDIWPDERFYFRSDHYNFARKGVPILFFFNGTHEDYHGAGDEPQKIDTEKMARIGKLLFLLGMEVGNADDRPQWNPESYAQIVEGDGPGGE